MNTYHMKLILSNSPNCFLRLTESCFKEFSDGLVGSCDGVGYIAVSRDAACLESAIKSALESAKIAGVAVEKISLDPIDYR